MFQKFFDTHNQNYKKRLWRLRTCMKYHKLDAFIIPRSDKYQNEFIQTRDERLLWISGFSGSSGICLVTLKSAYIFIDGRYKTQVNREVDTKLFCPIEISKISFVEWLHSNLNNVKVGYDPWLHTADGISNLTKSDKPFGQLIKCKNLIDEIWDTPAKPSKLIIQRHPMKYSGSSSKNKRDIIK